MKLSILTLLIITINASHSLNILAIFPYQGKSHFMVFKVLLQELAERGHKVTVISHFPQEKPKNNYRDISISGNNEIEDAMPPMQRSFLTILLTTIYLGYMGLENCEVMLSNEKVQQLIKDKPKFDVVVTEQFNSDCSLGIAYKLGAPVVGMTSHVIMPYHCKRLGIPYNPAFVSFHFLEGGTRPTLFQKFERIFFDVYIRTAYHYVQYRDQKTLAKYFDDIPPLEELAREIKFLLLYHNFILTGSKLFPANVIEVGGYHVAKAKPLTGALQKFLDEAEHGVIYISFGSVVKISSLPEDKLNAILEAMKEFPQKFIWKWEDETILADKNKLYISSWLPQLDILGHEKTLAFFSHGGMGSTTESIHYGVPMIAMPIFGDQPSNAAAIEESGLGVQLQYSDLNKETLVAALRKVLRPEFRERVQKISKAWHDRPMSPLDTAVYWIEFAARNSNFTFRTAAADVPFYQYMNLDVIFVFILIVAVLSIIVSTFCIRSKNKKPKRE